MKKKTYSKPVLCSEEFVPQEYVASCGDSGSNYFFECNAGPKKGGNVYLETNGLDGLQTTETNIGSRWHPNYVDADEYLGGYHPCGKKHEASTTSSFQKGYLTYGGIFDNKYTMDVIVWRGNSGTNIHCTDKLNKEDWETTKS